MKVDTFPVGPLGCNCSLVSDPTTGDTIVVDPGGDFERIAAKLAAIGGRVVAIVHTHTHVDHVGATAEVQRATSAPARIHEADRFLYDLLPVQAAMLGMDVPARAEIEGDLDDGVVLRAGGVELAVLHTPGHTPGSVSFVAGDVVFTGDTLFRGGIGRTDLWGGDRSLLDRSLRDRLLALPDGTRVVPGHGPGTSIQRERSSNPFLR